MLTVEEFERAQEEAPVYLRCKDLPRDERDPHDMGLPWAVISREEEGETNPPRMRCEEGHTEVRWRGDVGRLERCWWCGALKQPGTWVARRPR